MLQHHPPQQYVAACMAWLTSPDVEFCCSISRLSSSGMSGLDDANFFSAFSAIRSSAMKQAVIVDYWRQIAGYEDRQPDEVLRGASFVHPAAANRHAFSADDVHKLVELITKACACTLW